jgi:hypothetical protein
VKGTISSGNSLVGSRSNDQIGLGGITALSNGNYVVRSYAWNASSGAATWGNGATGTTGTVSSTNSLTGLVGDEVGAYVTVLTDGNYVVVSPNWNGNLGAATWGSGTTGVTGTVSSSNSLVGAAPNDSVGSGGIASLSNGNYVVASLYWSGNRGAATWGSGTAGVTGAISASNSLVGAAPNDYVGIGGIAALSNGNYVVGSPDWSGNTGAATLCNGANGTTGMISSSNSLVGTFANDKVGYAVLSLVGNGNYVVGSPYWGGNVGAVTWGSGISGVVGTISSSNSLIGSAANDYVGGHGAFQLNDGNYMVISPNWGGNLGASTWGNGAVGAHGLISSSNSLIGSAIGDEIGLGVPAVFDDDYVLVSPGYGGVGAVTMASNAYRLVGQIQSWNSVIGVASSYLVPLPLAYDSSRRRLVVGRPADNKISLFTAEQIFAANFDP